ncbi:MAG: sulfatase-like hydrolase/transferase [Oscillospiraceae bacterium]|jgi:arylsulfatase A-like enzyme
MKPNILFFFSDQQRYDTLGCNGQSLPVTPNLDKLAEEGVNFDCAFTPQPVCGPARACIQSGLYPTETGCTINGIAMPVEQDTLAKRMNDAGYRTAYVGKWHLASDMRTGHHYEHAPVPAERRGGYSDYWYVADMLELTSHGYDGYVFDGDNNKVEFKGYRADCITDFALNYLRDYDKEEPFFLMISHIEPHHQNDRNDFEGPEGSREKFKDFQKPDDLPEGVGDWEEYLPDYLGCCNALDRNLGRIIDLLKEKGMYENTLIIYASDHGCHFRTIDEREGNGFDDYKRNSFENTIHVPLVLRGPGFLGGKRVENLVSLMDLPATILEAGGAERMQGMHGRALQDVFTGKDWENAVYIQISESYVGRAVRTDRYKYVLHAPGKMPRQEADSDFYEEKYLFDLKNDPLERSNLVADPAYAGVKKQLRERLLAFSKDAGETILEIKEIK